MAGTSRTLKVDNLEVNTDTQIGLPDYTASRELFLNASNKLVELRNNLAATTDPSASNDDTEDYIIGSRWFNTSDGKMFFATDVTTSAAVWERVREVIIDTAANIAALPRVAGNFYYQTDTQEYKGDDGTSLIDIGGAGVTVDTRANIVGLSRSEGALYFASDTDEYLGDDGTNLIPVGVVKDTRSGIDSRTKDEGQIYFATDEDKWLGYDGVDLKDLTGGGGAGLNFYTNGDADNVSDTSNETTGNSATFGDSGTLQGVYSISTTAADLISGVRVRKLVLNATPGSSDNDWVESEAINIPQGFRGREISIPGQYKYNGANNDIQWVVRDITNGVNLGVLQLPAANRSGNVADKFEVSVFCPTNCSQISVGPQVLTHATGSEEFIWDDVVVNDEISIASLQDRQTVRYQTFAGNGSTATKIPYFTNERDNVGQNILQIENDSTNGFSATALTDCTVDFTWQTGTSGSTPIGISLNASSVTTNIQSLVESERVAYSTTGNFYETVSVNIDMKQGDVIRPHSDGTSFTAPTFTNISINAWADSDAFVNTKTGTENKFKARIANNGTATITSQDVEWIDSVTRTGAGVVSVNFVPGFFTEVPAIEADAAEAVSSSTFWNIVSPTTSGCEVRSTNISGTATDYNFVIGAARQGTDYKNPSATAAVPSQRVAVVKNNQSSGVGGGTFTSGSYQTVASNTLEGDTSFIRISSDQIELQPGTYRVNGRIPCFSGQNFKTKLEDVDNTIDIIVGSSGLADSAGSTAHTVHSFIVGEFTISDVTTFEIKMRVGTTTGTAGGGVAAAFGDTETYAITEFIKLR